MIESPDQKRSMNSGSDETVQFEPTDATVSVDGTAAAVGSGEPVDSAPTPSTRTRILAKIGIVLILCSGVFFFLMLSVPWWPISGTNKALMAGGLLIGVEVAWWVGAVCAGPATVGAIRRWFVRS